MIDRTYARYIELRSYPWLPQSFPAIELICFILLLHSLWIFVMCALNDSVVSSWMPRSLTLLLNLAGSDPTRSVGSSFLRSLEAVLNRMASFLPTEMGMLYSVDHLETMRRPACTIFAAIIILWCVDHNVESSAKTEMVFETCEAEGFQPIC